MEGKQFDQLTKVLRRTEPRRGLLAALGAGVLLRTGLSSQPAQAKKSKKRELAVGSKCVKGDKNRTCGHDSICLDASGQVPQKGKIGRCSCTADQAHCNADCVWLSDLTVCPVNEFPRCNDNDNCLCTKTVEEQPYCAQATNCLAPCTSSASCPLGSACVITCCDGPGQASPHCLPACG